MQYIKSKIPNTVKYQIRKVFGLALPPRIQLIEQLPKQSVGLEIGVHEGQFSRLLLDLLQPSKLHLIDPWEYIPAPELTGSFYSGSQVNQQVLDARYNNVRSRLQAYLDRGQVEIHRAYSSDVVDEFPDEYFDWIYIDGNHLYEYVKQDLTLYYPKVKPGGYVCGDDYGAVGWWEDGITRATDEFVALHQLDLTVFGTQFLIQKS